MRVLLIPLCVVIVLPMVGSVERKAAPSPPANSSDSDLLRTLFLKARSLAEAGEYLKAINLFEHGYRQDYLRGNTTGAIRFLTSLANCHHRLFQYGDAMEAYLEARRLAKESGDLELSTILSINIAGLYITQNAYDDADQAIEMALEASPSRAARFAASALATQALIRVLQERYSEAAPLFRRAIDEAQMQGNEATLLQTMDWFGDALITQGQIAEAEKVVLETTRRRKAAKFPLSDFCYRNLALLALAKGDLRVAERRITEAFEAAHHQSLCVVPWSLYYSRARIHVARDRLKEALADLDRALAYITSLRLAHLPADTVRAGAGVGLQQVYGLYIDVLNTLYLRSGSENYARLSFEVSEQNRAIALRDTMSEFEAIRPHLSPEYWQTLRRLSEAEDALFRGDAPGVKHRAEQLRHQLIELEIEAGLKARTRQNAKDLPSGSVSLEEVQRALHPSEALLGFQQGSNHFHLWAITSGRFELHRLDSADKVGHRIRDFRDALQRNERTQSSLIGRELYGRLFGKVHRQILAKSSWLLLLDGVLFELPLGALVPSERLDRPHYLIENHTLRLLPSAAMLLAPKEPPWRGPLLALGDPIYNQADRRWTVSAWQRVRNFATLWDTSGVKTAELARLVGSAKEIDFCSRSYRGSETPVVLLGPRATSAEFEASLARRPSVIHLATHIVPAPGDSQVGYIALSLRPDGAPEFYGFNDISALSLNPRLVVMAGCNSGGGVQLPGEGLWGLTRAWLRAGAHSVAATSWPVLDQHGELLQSFYRFLSEEPHLGRPEIALQRAQIEMINSEKWKARSDYWAAYFVVSRN